ncbi:hypothetical protein F5876DRAFT_48914 [Lentinula aff. lateritia]|uniref:Uncharacterized protein n=1 Tax=Lentinula aff. lateritia TaxID=2804960 RepID=A0ACC1TR77_9AGAR|nr:hypothetical protein F5876DRAFT_48914 [Lentinula aff. lateritia]
MNAKNLSPIKSKLPLSTTNSKPSSSFNSVEPIHLLPFINSTSALIIDIRPHAAYSSARIPTALSLSVPSTLLKRPLFSLDRLGAMLPSSSARARFAEWPKFTTIVVYDVDSIGSPFLPEGNNILGLLRKFSNDAAYNGNALFWLKGGFQRVWRERRDLVDFRPPEPEPEDDANEPGSLKTNHLPPKAFGSGTTTRSSLDLSSPRKRLSSTMSLRANAPLMSEKTSGTSSVPFNPFFDTIRQNIELTQGITERIPLRLPKRVRKRIDDLPFEWLREISRRADVKPDDSFTSDGDESPSSTSENKSNATNHPSPESSGKFFPPDIHHEHEGMEALAMQFYRIELAEQRRLMGVMKHHSAESGPTVPHSISESDSDHGRDSKTLFPYSITAGVEKGAKNRYRHIWPFEHARVRLHARRHSPSRKSAQSADSFQSHGSSQPSASTPTSEDHDDYVNASYVQPLCTTKRYIATQGPLEATFVDFWTLVYQQNVHVIIMLTREIEGSMVKCGPYWKDEVFGPLRLKLMSVEGNVDEGKDDDVRRKASGRDPAVGGFFFSSPVVPDPKLGKKKKKNPADAIIKRTFLLSHVGYPDIPPRKIVQFQYLEWPDMNVPDDPRGVLGLIKEVDQAVTEAMHLNGQGEEEEDTIKSGLGETLNRNTGIANKAMGRKHSPVLLHCSAGVGRTGGFIMVDAVLDGIRREFRKQKNLCLYHEAQNAKNVSWNTPSTMDVDVKNEETAVQDEQGFWNRTGNCNVDIASNKTDLRTVAIPAHNSGNILHVPVHTSTMTPMQVDGHPYTSSTADNREEDEKETVFPHQSFTTRMWAEDVSDQTGSHGTAFRVDEAVRQLHSQNRLSEWDVSNARLKVQIEGNIERASSVDPRSMDVNMSGSSRPTSSGPGQPIATTPGATIGLPSGDAAVVARGRLGSIPFVFPSSSIDSASSSDDSYDFKNGLKGMPRHRSGHHTLNSLSYGESAILSSTGTSFSSPQSLPDSAMPKARAVEKSPSPFSRIRGIDLDESASLPPPSRSLSPPSRTDVPTSAPLKPQSSGNNARTSNSSADLSYPRALHHDNSPQALSNLGEPLLEVLQDMREQRMSLCQSLRQYVFVHAAVIEGALMIVDEERERERKTMRMDVDDIPSMKQSVSSVTGTSSSSSRHSWTTTTGKRVASPTELPKEDKKGAQMLFKRPSIKKKLVLSNRSQGALESDMA